MRALSGREDLSIEVKDHVLTIKGERAQRRPEEQCAHQGLPHVSLSNHIDSASIQKLLELTLAMVF